MLLNLQSPTQSVETSHSSPVESLAYVVQFPGLEDVDHGVEIA
jgi:hypothetical protein